MRIAFTSRNEGSLLHGRVSQPASFTGGDHACSAGPKSLENAFARPEVKVEFGALSTDVSSEPLISQWAGIEARANRPEDENGSVS